MRTELEARYPTLHMVGRNGMHRYNNQDHAMMTAMLTVENIAAGSRVYNIWNVNEDAEYHEAGDEGEQAVFADPSVAKGVELSDGQIAALKSERDVPKRIGKGDGEAAAEDKPKISKAA
jgi:hypothetical protein